MKSLVTMNLKRETSTFVSKYPFTEKQILALRPEIYSNTKIHGHAIFLSADCRILHISNLGDFPAAARAVLQRKNTAGDARPRGKKKSIKSRFKELDRLRRKGIAELVGALAKDEDPVVKLLLIQRVKTVKGDAAREFWKLMLTDSYVDVQDTAVKHLAGLGAEALSICAETLGPLIEQQKWTTREWYGEPPKEIYLHRNTAWTLVEKICRSEEPGCGMLVAALYQRIPNGAGLEYVADYFETLSRRDRSAEAARAIINALDIFDGYHYGSIPLVRKIASRLFDTLRRFKCPVPEPDWDDQEECKRAVEAAWRWWNKKFAGKITDSKVNAQCGGNEPSQFRFTPLYIAKRGGHQAVARLLIANGASE